MGLGKVDKNKEKPPLDLKTRYLKVKKIKNVYKNMFKAKDSENDKIKFEIKYYLGCLLYLILQNINIYRFVRN